MAHKVRRPRGFTIIELMIVVAIIGIVSSLAGVGILYGNARAKLSNSVFEVSAMVSAAQMRAMASGKPNYLVFYQTSAGAFGIAHVERDETATPPAWSAVDAGNLATAGGVVLNQVALSTTKALSLGTVTSFTALPAPFAAVPMTAPGSSGLLGACSFCISATNGNLGALRFTQDGRVTVGSGSADTPGAAFVLNGQAGGEKSRSKLIAVVLPSGTLKVVDL